MLEGEHVSVAPLRDEDSEPMFAWINDRDLVILNAPFEPVDAGAHRRWFDQIRERDDVEIFGIRRDSDDLLIGSCQLLEIDREAGTCELQIRIGEAAGRDRGYGTETVGLLLRHAFEGLGLGEVRLDVFADNERAIRAYEKAGFERRETRPGATLIEGERKDVVVMSVRREEEAGDGG